MQQQGGFLDQGNKSPTSLMLVAGMHVAAIGALILFPPSFIIPEKPPVFFVDSIAADPPPPPIEDPPPPLKKADEQVTQPETVGPAIPSSTEIGFDKPVETILPPSGPTLPTQPEPAKPAPPVMREASIDPHASFQPNYPPRLARQEIEGNAVVRVLIGTDGRVKAVEMVSATDPEFFEAARKQALRFWRFKPATRDGVAVESWRTMTLRFEMKA